MTFWEFIDQIIFIIKNLSLSFWVSVIIISPLFMLFEQIFQGGITKILYVIFIRFPNKYKLVQRILGFSDADSMRSFKGYMITTKKIIPYPKN